uniref:Sperm-specific protein ZC168.6 n=1 Tax=Ascaris suum TaxID=6253 RepID=F1LFC6_ASCSU
MTLTIMPSSCKFAASGGTTKFAIYNITDGRLAFKVKTTNVVNYRVQPVYGFVEKRSKADLIILRLPGPPKEDKFYIQWADVQPEETEPEAPFKAGAQIGEVVLTISTNESLLGVK